MKINMYEQFSMHDIFFVFNKNIKIVCFEEKKDSKLKTVCFKEVTQNNNVM